MARRNGRDGYKMEGRRLGVFRPRSWLALALGLRRVRQSATFEIQL